MAITTRRRTVFTASPSAELHKSNFCHSYQESVSCWELCRSPPAFVAPPAKSLEVQLWDAANKMRGSVPPADYMHVCLGLVFLRYISAAFERKQTELLATPHADANDPEEYQANNVFWVPEAARWSN